MSNPLYEKIEIAVLRERQRAISASCFMGDDDHVRVVVCFPVSEATHKNIVYRVDRNKASAENDPFHDVITLWEA